ncbi:MAG TPA: LytTR family transcriptional regulator DNA-binding domain-containing protein [Bacteroidales bacterium]|nr:LytTR family transcriptional regulator DNA-binding domain-containing protein [Bacteroidales bacterium]
MSIKAIIIDDEQPAREIIKHYLGAHENIIVIGEFSDGFAGIKGINELKPDLVFLDIQMPKLTGFEMLELLDATPYIIFTTAYDQYAIKAFEMNAVDYLLKPYSQERFNQALLKANERMTKADKPAIKKLTEHLAENQETLDRVVVKTGNKIKVIPEETILYIESQDDYVMIYTGEGKFLKQQTMKYFEQHLDPRHFVRIHRSYIANIDTIKQLELYEKNSYLAVLSNGAKLKVSDSGYKLLKSMMKF